MFEDYPSMLPVIIISCLFCGFLGYMAGSPVLMGKKGQECFSNNTCLTQDLMCLHGEGFEPGRCVKKKEGN